MIELSHISKEFVSGKRTVHAVQDVSLTIGKSEIFGMIGFSGAGKSTLVRCINLLERPTSGKVIVDGQDMLSLSAKELRQARKKIGMIFQSFNLVTRTKVIKNVLMAKVPDLSFIRALLGIYPKDDKLAALEALDKVGILDKAFVRADQLSGGQQQRVALARTLAQNPQIILADEPVASLDPVTAKQVMEDFQRINKEMNITILLNIHHVELALTYASRVVGIRAGQIVYDGPVSDVNEEILNNIYEGKLEQEVAG